MREKLIELLRQCECESERCEDCRFDGDYEGCYRRQAEIVADHLIANGATITAVPLGSTVYALRNHIEYTNSKGETKVNEYQIVTNNVLKTAIKRNTVVIKEKKAGKQDILLLGRLVFKTREEAEAAIRRGEA